MAPVPAGSASAIDFQQPLALTVELARVTEEHRSTPRPDEAIGDLGVSPADITDAVNPAIDGSPAQGLANKVIENIQPGPTSAEKLSDALGNPATDDAPKLQDKLQDAIEQPAEMLKPGREVSVLACPLALCRRISRRCVYSLWPAVHVYCHVSFMCMYQAMLVPVFNSRNQ